METNNVEVYDSYKFSNGTIIACLKSASGKIPASTLLVDEVGRQWRIQQYYWTTTSPEGYEKIQAEEEQNIFQYILKGINNQDKPTKGSILKIEP